MGKVGGIFETHGLYILISVVVGGALAWLSDRWLFDRGVKSSSNRFSESKTPRLVILLQQIGILIVLFVCIRGGLQKKPLNFAHGQIFQQVEINQLVLNSGFSLVQSLGRVALLKEHHFEFQKMLSLLNGARSEEIPPVLPDVRFKNVVVLLVESLSLEFFTEKPQVVPFLSKLAEHSLFLTDAFANARRSIEGVSAVISGVPALMNEPFISSTFSNNHLLSLGQIFKERGFETSFYHGGYNGTMYFDQYTRRAGFENYRGAKEYPGPKSDDDGSWGIYDEPFLSWMADSLCLPAPPKPTLTVLFTLTSHHPFHIPEEYQKPYASIAEPIDRSIRYTDHAIEKFFEKIKKCSSYSDTLFVITADHAFNQLTPNYQNHLGEFQIPIFFYSPRVKTWPEILHTQSPVSQIDLLPSLADAMRFEVPLKNHLSRSIFRPTEDRKVVLFEDQHHWLVRKNDFLFQQTREQSFLFARTDKNQTTPLTSEFERKHRADDELKAAQQFFSEGLWYDRLYLEKE